MSRSTRAVVTAAAAAALSAVALLGPVAVGVAVVVLVLVLALGWPALLDVPWVLGARTVLALTGLGGVVSVWLDGGSLELLPLVVACGLVLAFVREMLRTDGRERLVDSISAVVAGSVVGVCGAGWVATVTADAGPDIVVVTAGALSAASVAAVVLPWKGWPNVAISVVAGAGAAVAIAAVLPGTQIVAGLVLGAASGVLAASLHVLLERLPSARTRTGGVASAVVPVLVLGVVGHVVGHLVGAI